MSRGSWRTIIKVAGLTVLAFAAVSLFSSLTWHSTALENEASNRSNIHRQNAHDRIEWVCPTAISQPDCIDETNQSARENEREEQDLAAQKITAWWTKIMGIAALIGMALSAVGVWLIKTTFDETRKSNHIAVNEQRAWVTLSAKPQLVRKFGFDGLYIRVDFMAQNKGATVAKEFDFCSTLFFQGPDESGDLVAEQINKFISQWKSQINDTGQSALLPNDIETTSIWQSFKAVDVKWRELHTGKAAYPILIAAVFYQTVNDPETMQLSWRSWYLNSIGDDGQMLTFIPLPDQQLDSESLCVDSFHSSLMHEEYKPDKKT